MTDHNIRETVGKTLRSPVGAAVSVTPLRFVAFFVGMLAFDGPDNTEGPLRMQSLKQLEMTERNLQEQKQELTRLKRQLQFSNSPTSREIHTRHEALTKNFNDNATTLLHQIYTDPNLSENEAYEYYQELCDFLEDNPPPALKNDIHFDSDDFTYLRDARSAEMSRDLPKKDYIENIKSTMAENGKELTIISLLVLSIIGCFTSSVGMYSVRKFARCQKFENWEKGHSASPFRYKAPKC